jgi:hypothetical protein
MTFTIYIAMCISFGIIWKLVSNKMSAKWKALAIAYRKLNTEYQAMGKMSAEVMLETAAYLERLIEENKRLKGKQNE